MSGSDAIDVAFQVAAAIEAAGGRYFVGGSVASSLRALACRRETRADGLVPERSAAAPADLARVLGGLGASRRDRAATLVDGNARAPARPRD